MTLKYKKIGTDGEPLIFLHGLYAMGDVWTKAANALKDKFTIFLPDLRNHGASPHSKNFDYNVLISDLKNLYNINFLKTAYLVGHSLGGRIALLFAEKYPEMVKKAVIIDIPPRNLTENEFFTQGLHKKIIKTLLKTNLKQFKNRKQVIDYFVDNLKIERLSFFLAKNIKTLKDGSLDWKLNLKAIHDNLKNIANGFNDFNFKKLSMPLLFLKGEKSPYIKTQDIELIKKNFPNANVMIFPNATHWLYTEYNDLFVKTILNFFD